MMYMPLISSACTASMISTTVRPRLGSSFLPQAFSYFAIGCSGVLHRLVVGEEHRDEPGVGGALHVVLAAQRMQAGAGAADLAGDQRQRDQAARIVGAVGVLRDAHAPEDDGAFRARIGARHVAQRLGVDAADRRHLLRREVLDVARRSWSKALDVGLHILLVVAGFSATMTLSMPLSIATSVPFLNCSMCQAWRLSACPRGSMTMSLAPRLAACLKKVAATGWFSVGLAPMTMMTSEFLHLVEGRGHRAGADALDQRRHRRGVAEPRAVIDIVGAEAGAHQLLEQIGLLVRALGRAEAGKRARAVAVADVLQARGGAVRAPRPRSPRGNASTGWPDRPDRRRLSARRPCGSAACVRRCGLVT